MFRKMYSKQALDKNIEIPFGRNLGISEPSFRRLFPGKKTLVE